MNTKDIKSFTRQQYENFFTKYSQALENLPSSSDELLLHKHKNLVYPVNFCFDRNELNCLAGEIGIDRVLSDKEVFDISTVMMDSPFVLDIMQEIKEVIEKAVAKDKTELWRHGQMVGTDKNRVTSDEF